MRIAIVDDNPTDRSELLQMLMQYCDGKKIEAEYEQFDSSEAFLSAFLPQKYDLAFLDVYMGGISGMDAARKVYAIDPHCRLIFSTTSHTHAVESYDVRAAYYLTKPLVYNHFVKAMDSCCLDLIKSNQYLTCHIKQIQTQVLLRSIVYVDCVARKTCIHLSNQTLVLDDSIGHITEFLLADDRFLCCNRNVIVNMEQILSVDSSDFLLTTNEHLPIRQRGKSNVKKNYLAYSLRDLRRNNS
ncbi:MAG: LytTR family DNA-binding domain-containing protein [Christensenellaceae bacterium]